MEWYTIIVTSLTDTDDSYQLLDPKQWIDLANTGDVESVLKDILNESCVEKTLGEAIRMTRDEMIEKEGTDDVELINAGRPEEERVELDESQSQEISGEYDRLSKKYGIDFEDLVYGEEGFMKTKYPNNFPDFAGDVIYSEKYWNELVEFAKEKGIDLTGGETSVNLLENRQAADFTKQST